MKFIAAIIAFVGVYGTLILANSVNTNAPISPNLKLVATVDGKSFFADSSQMNWTAAGEYCAGLGMTLAEIRSKAQFDALNAAHSSTDFQYGHWIAGRDAQLPRQFSWNSTGDAISNEYFDIENHANTQYQTCLFINVFPNNASVIKLYPCHKSEIQVLCST